VRRSRPAARLLRPGRLLAAGLLFLAVAMYAGPLQDFFAQQDRYQQEAAALAAAKAENAALKAQVERLMTRRYVAEQARRDALLVPPGSQVFVIKGLPEEGDEPGVVPAVRPTGAALSLLDRLEDLWRTVAP
jgi:cell division protein FtsB